MEKRKTTTTNKNGVNKLLKGVYKVNFKTLSGCIKSFSDAMKAATAEEVAEIAAAEGISIVKARKIVAFAKDRKAVYTACKAVLPQIDNYFVEYKVIVREYKLKDKADKSFDLTKEVEGSFVIGKAYKPWGVKDVVELVPTYPALIHKDSDTYKSTYAPFAIAEYKVAKVMKAVVDYIAHCEKNNLPLK